jgi:hypothetical protein
MVVEEPSDTAVIIIDRFPNSNSNLIHVIYSSFIQKQTMAYEAHHKSKEKSIYQGVRRIRSEGRSEAEGG